MRTQYTFYVDPGHGWLQVKRDELIRLGIADKISGCSYAYGDNVYLEEDCDATLFVDAKKARGERVNTIDKFSNNSSRIRNYRRYLVPEEESKHTALVNTILKHKTWHPKDVRRIQNFDFYGLHWICEQYDINIEGIFENSGEVLSV